MTERKPFLIKVKHSSSFVTIIFPFQKSNLFLLSSNRNSLDIFSWCYTRHEGYQVRKNPPIEYSHLGKETRSARAMRMIYERGEK